MPRVSFFHGISIYIYYLDHPPPHFEAQCGDSVANVAIATGEIIEGSLPPRAERLVRRWVRLRKPELEMNWSRARANLPLLPVAGLE